MQGSVAADSVHNHDHNVNSKHREKMSHVDNERICLNEVLVSDDLREVYCECFGEAVAAYNERQGRADRRIADYYDKISASKQEHLAYEIVVQVGDRDNNPAATLDDAGRERMTAIYQDYLTRFTDRYGHVLRVFEAVVHYDEATPHMHLAYVPVAKNEGGRGLEVKNSMRQAMRNLGFYVGSKEERVDFYHDAQDLLTEVMATHGIEREASRYDRANRGDMTKEEYAEFSRNQEKIAQRRDLVNALGEALTDKSNEVEERIQECERLERKRDELIAEVAELNRQVTDLRHEKGVLEAAVEKLKEVAGRIMERLQPYLPNPIVALARILRDEEDYYERDRWHDAMDDTAWDLVDELPSWFDELVAEANLASESMPEHAPGTRSRSERRDEWSI